MSAAFQSSRIAQSRDKVAQLILIQGKTRLTTTASCIDVGLLTIQLCETGCDNQAAPHIQAQPMIRAPFCILRYNEEI